METSSMTTTTIGYPTLKQAWWLIVILILWQIPMALPMGALKYLEEAYAINMYGLPETIAYVGSFLLTIWYAFRKRKSSRLALASVPLVTYPLIAVGTAALGFLIEPITSALPTPEWLDNLMKQLFTKNMIISAVIAAPILEEILLRGIILHGLLKNYTPTKAIIWSAVIFGVMHMNPVQAVGAFILGLALGWLYYRTQSLLPCIALHFFNNSLGSLPIFFDDNLDMSANYTRSLIANDGLYGGLLLLSLILCFACYQLLNRVVPKID